MTPGTRLGTYEIVAAIGAGGMGRVFRARDTKLDRDVAIKVLPVEMADDPHARERLRLEAMAAAALDHPYICKILEIGEHGPTRFLVMEYVAGETLHDRLRAGRMPLAEALRVAVQMADALEVAHERGIVHRDLKPGNVMLTPQGHVKIMDFGLARRTADPGAHDAETREGAPPRAHFYSAGGRRGSCALAVRPLPSGRSPSCRSTTTPATPRRTTSPKA